MNKTLSKLKKKWLKIYVALSGAALIYASNFVMAYAGGTTAAPPSSSSSSDDGGASDGFAKVVEVFEEWIDKIGGVIILVGGVQFALAIKSEDAEGKQRALMTMAAGAAAIAVKVALSATG
jgi:hypothetical protein